MQGGRRPPFIGGSKTSRWTSTNHGTTALRGGTTVPDTVLPPCGSTTPLPPPLVPRATEGFAVLGAVVRAVLPPCGSTTPLLPLLVPQATERFVVLRAVVRCGTTATRYYRGQSGTTVVERPRTPRPPYANYSMTQWEKVGA